MKGSGALTFPLASDIVVGCAPVSSTVVGPVIDMSGPDPSRVAPCGRLHPVEILNATKALSSGVIVVAILAGSS